MRPTLLLLAILLLPGATLPLRAQPTFGVGDYVRNAETIERVQAEEAFAPPDDAFPPLPSGQRRVWVKEVLKGVDTTQEFLVPAASLAPGQEALVVFPYEPPVNSDIAVRQRRDKPLPQPFIWPLDAATGKVNTGPITAGQGSTWNYDPKAINLVEQRLIRETIARQSPEQVGLNTQVLDAVLFPERLPAAPAFGAMPSSGWSRTLAKLDPSQRANFVRFSAAIYNLDHDVTALARLLESRAPELRAAAARKLEALTGDRVPAPGEVSAEEMREWIKFQAKRVGSKPVDRWPAVPENLQLPPDGFPPALLQSLAKNDADSFAREFARWMDSGVQRDRSIRFAARLSRQVVEENSLEGGIGGYGRNLPYAPRLRPELVFNPALPAEERMQGIALFAQLVHFDRFARERAAATDLIPNKGTFADLRSVTTGPSNNTLNAKMFPTKGGADVETLRRAAFWEISGLFNQFSDPGQMALCRLAEREDEESQRFVMALCLNPEGRGIKDAVLTEVQMHHQPFVRDTLSYLGSHQDEPSQRIANFFDESGEHLTTSYYLNRMKDASASAGARREAARQLCYYPDPRAAEDLIGVYQAEADPEVKKQLLMALAQTGDPRTLDLLLAALPSFTDLRDKMEVARGLGRVRDKRVLPVLADLVSSVPDDGSTLDHLHTETPAGLLRRDAAQAFGWVAGYKDVFPPTEYSAVIGICAPWIARDLRRVEAWREKGVVVPDATGP